MAFRLNSMITRADRWLLMPLAGRCAIVVHMALLPYARPSGLANQSASDSGTADIGARIPIGALAGHHRDPRPGLATGVAECAIVGGIPCPINVKYAARAMPRRARRHR